MTNLKYLSYASVLFEMSQKENKIEKFVKDAKLVLQVFNTVPEVLKFLCNTSIPSSERKKILLNLFNKKINKKIIYFIWATIDFNKIRSLDKILKNFIKLSQQNLGILDVNVTSAYKLSNKQIESIKNYIIKKTKNKNVSLNNVIDQSILGGIKIESNSMIIDGSIKNRLNMMKKESLLAIREGLE